MYILCKEFVVLRDVYKVDIRWIHLVVINKSVTINEEAIGSHRFTTFALRALPQ